MTWQSNATPSADSTANNTMAQAIGNKLDAAAGGSGSVIDLSKQILAAVGGSALKQSDVHPQSGSSINVPSGFSTWVLGSFVNIASSGLSNNAEITGVFVEGLSTNQSYRLVLYKGASGSEIEVAGTNFIKTTAHEGLGYYPVSTNEIASGTRISARLATSGASGSVDIRIQYNR